MRKTLAHTLVQQAVMLMLCATGRDSGVNETEQINRRCATEAVITDCMGLRLPGRVKNQFFTDGIKAGTCVHILSEPRSGFSAGKPIVTLKVSYAAASNTIV